MLNFKPEQVCCRSSTSNSVSPVNLEPSAGVKLVSCWMFGGCWLESSCDLTEVHPVRAAGGRSADLQSLAGPLETDLGTVIKSLSIHIWILNNWLFFNIQIHLERQHTVLLHWSNKTHCFLLYFSASSLYMNINMQKSWYIFFSVASMSCDPVTPNQHQIMFISGSNKTLLFLLCVWLKD